MKRFPVLDAQASVGLSRITLLGAVLALSACAAVGPDYQRPEPRLPHAFEPSRTTSAPDAAVLAPRWWMLFEDARLNTLVQSALERHPDARAAAARVDETEAVLVQARAARLPEVGLQGASTLTRATQVGAVPLPAGIPVNQESHRYVLSTTFEIDFWGRLRRADEAARAQALGSQYGREVVSLALASATVQTYLALRTLDAQSAVSQSALRSREESLDLVRKRAAAGLVSDLDLAQATAALADARVALTELERQRSLVENQLAALTGEPGLKLTVTEGLGVLPLPPVPPPGLPSSLLDRRPDVMQAEQTLVSATALIGVAKAAEYPTFSLTAFLGGQAADLGNVLVGGGRVGQLGASVFWPVIDAGRYAARTREAQARAEQAAAAYDKAVLNAWKEVADALSSLDASRRAEAEVQTRLQASREALRLATARYERGYSGYLDVLDAQRTFSAAEQAAVSARQAQLGASVDLMKALGGGWTPATPVATHLSPTR